MKPPFRWVGGKTRLLPYIDKYLPHEAWGEHVNINRYFEPMMGGGAVFWSYGEPVANHCFLNDINYPLMNAYACLRSVYADVRIEAMKLDDLSYNEVRQKFNRCKQLTGAGWDAELAAMFCMLMGTCFNGVYRENLSGGFNCPQGKDSKGKRHEWSRVDWEGLQKAGAGLLGAAIAHGSIFPWPWENARPGLGDVVVYDPPFAGEFSDYHSSRFTLEHHASLRDQAQGWADNGATVVVCGSNNEWSWKVYGQPTEVVPIQRNVGNSLRGMATEALYVMEPKS